MRRHVLGQVSRCILENTTTKGLGVGILGGLRKLEKKNKEKRKRRAGWKSKRATERASKKEGEVEEEVRIWGG